MDGISLIAISVLLGLVVLEAILILLGGKLYFNLLFLKFKLTKGKGLFLNFKKSRDVSISLVKPKSEYSYGKEDEADKVSIMTPYNREESSGIPVYVLVEGVPNNVDINDSFSPLEQSKLINQNFVKAFNAGVIKGMKDFLSMNNPISWVMLGVAGAAVLALVAAYYGYANNELISGQANACFEGMKSLLQDSNSLRAIVQAAT